MIFDPRWNRFSTGDIDEAHEFMASAYVDLDVLGVETAESFQMRATAAHLDDVLLSRAQYAAGSVLRTAPNDDLIVVQVHRGHYALDDGREQHAVSKGHTLLLSPDRAIDLRVHDFDLTAVKLRRALIEQVAEEATGETGPVRFESARPMSRALEHHWTNTVAYVSRVVLPGSAGTAPGVNALMVAQARRLLAAAALVVYPNSAMLTDPGPAGRVDAPVVRRAAAYIEENANRDVSVTETAAAAGVGVRALQEAFRRHLGITPSGYARRVRLERAHLDLQKADPAAGDTVAAIAARWGFAHQGRFAAYYRAAYGRSPSRTLRT